MQEIKSLFLIAVYEEFARLDLIDDQLCEQNCRDHQQNGPKSNIPDSFNDPASEFPERWESQRNAKNNDPIDRPYPKYETKN